MSSQFPDQTLSEDSLSSPTATRNTHAWLVFIGSSENQFSGAGEIWPIDSVSTIVFGRGTGESTLSERCDGVLQIKIPLGWVSRKHAEIRVVTTDREMEFDLRDLESRNGTYIEGQSVPGLARLAPGQVFEVGRSFWVVRELAMHDVPPQPVRSLAPAETSNPELCGIHRSLAQLADSNVSFMLRGETGTGKEVAARSIHRISGRKGAFVSANLAVLSEDRIDPILFGQRRRLISGSKQESPGLLEQADHGTLYLDELSELTSQAQAKLLAALADGQIVRSGKTEREPFDVRIISSSLVDVHNMVLSGKFRPDLYSRLSGFEAEIPPLRNRREDLGVLTRTLCKTRNGGQVRVSTPAFRRILGYGWSFNIRELGQTLATASILAGTGGEITREVLEEILDRRRDMPDSPETVTELRNQLVSQLARSGGNTAEVARAMERDQKEIHRWLERFELQSDAYKLG